jgi:thiamine transport system permease protein
MNRLPRWFVPALAAVPVVVVGLFYAWPFATLLAHGLSRSAIADTLGDTVTWRVVWFTLWQAVVSTAITIVVGLAPAYVIARFDFRGRRLLDSALVAVFVLPTVVVGAAVLAVMPSSFERGVVAIIAAHVLFNLAVVVRTVGAVLATLPRDREAAAATLGASPRRVFGEITLPAIIPAMGAAASIVFVFTFTSFGVVRIVGGVRNSTIEVEIWRQATRFGDIGSAATLTVVQLAALAAMIAAMARLQRRRSRALGLTVAGQRRRPRRGGQRRLVAITALGTTAIVLVPMVALVERSLRSGDDYSLHAWRHLGAAEVRPGLSIGADPAGALLTSLRFMVVAVLFATVVGSLAALAIAAATGGGKLLDTAMMLPIATSAVTIGFGILITFDQDPFDWRGSWLIVPIGHALVAIPFVVRTILPVLRGVEVRRLEAAATLGASPLWAWRSVVLPHVRRPLVVAAGLAAAISLGEFGATSFLSRSGQETMPIAIERLLGRTGTLLQGQGYALAVILAAATITVVLVLDLAHVHGVPRPRRPLLDTPRLAPRRSHRRTGSTPGIGTGEATS